MEKTVNLSALRIAGQLDLKVIKNHLALKPEADSSYELFYAGERGQYACYFSYGVVVFADYSEAEITEAVEKIKTSLKNPASWMRENYQIKVAAGEQAMRFEFDHLVTRRFDSKIVRTAMFNLAQSAALNHYHTLSEMLLGEVRGFTNNLEVTGNLRINRKNTMKFIGRALNSQNDIAGNMYIFVAPKQVWDDPDVDALHQRLLNHFDLRVRVSEIEYTLRIIEDNLKVFLQISNQRESSRLEWIIIILILIEIFDVLLTQWLKYL